jgi:NADPH:quinone reductase-like Zn-dependent oxidoreductase
MKAAVINKWGNPDVFELTEVNKPQIRPDQLLIKVFASSINPVDWKHRTGYHKYVLGAPFPIILGYDVCGEVVEAGSSITKFKVGDIVFGDLDNKYGGGLAEYAVGHEKCFALKPSNITNEQAAALPLVSLTALQALRDKAGLKKGDTILINGASGGVGHISVQIAKIMGGRVIAVAGGRNQSFIESLYPDTFIDYTKQNVLSFEEKFDVFLDTIGNYSFLKTKHLLKDNGIYITTLPRPKILIHKIFQIFSKGKKVKTLLRKHSESDIEQIAQWVKEDKLKVTIDKTFSLEEIKKAYAYAEEGHTTGKNVIVINK